MWLRPTPSKQKSTLFFPCFTLAVSFPTDMTFLLSAKPECSFILYAVPTNAKSIKRIYSNIPSSTALCISSQNLFLPACSRRSVVASLWSYSLWPTLAGGILGRSLGATPRGSFWTCRTDEEPSWWGRARPLKVREQTLQRLQALSRWFNLVFCISPCLLIMMY